VLIGIVEFGQHEGQQPIGVRAGSSLQHVESLLEITAPVQGQGAAGSDVDMLGVFASLARTNPAMPKSGVQGRKAMQPKITESTEHAVLAPEFGRDSCRVLRYLLSSSKSS
jgi:hypothetical protein